jgi:hypothetical protein
LQPPEITLEFIDISHLYQEYEKLKQKRLEYKKLKSAKLPPSLEEMKTLLEGKEFALDIKDEVELEKTKEEMVKVDLEYTSKKKLLDDNRTTQKEIDSLKVTIDKLQKRVKGVVISKPKYNRPKIESELLDLIRESSYLTNNIQSQMSILDHYSEYEEYLRTSKEIEELDNTLTTTHEKLEKEESRLDGLYGLAESEKEAEIITLEGTVNSINEHAKVYLDQMFEEPITVRLECQKESGKDLKIKLNTYIYYKGEEWSPSEISGGEIQRCEVAFVLGVNDMVGSKLLMFDESFNELDPSNNTNVLTMVREMCVGKLVLVVTHEAIRGIFDKEIDITHK